MARRNVNNIYMVITKIAYCFVYESQHKRILSMIGGLLQAIGRPVLPPYWALGFQLSRWGYIDINDMWTVINRTREAQIPYVSRTLLRRLWPFCTAGRSGRVGGDDHGCDDDDDKRGTKERRERGKKILKKKGKKRREKERN